MNDKGRTAILIIITNFISQQTTKILVNDKGRTAILIIITNFISQQTTKDIGE